MPLQKPISIIISRSKRVRCSMRCASISFICETKNSFCCASSTLIASIAFSTFCRPVT